MALKIEISVKVYESEHNGYKDPNGYEEVTLTCVESDLSGLLAPSDQIASTLLKVAHLKYLAAVAEKEEDTNNR